MKKHSNFPYQSHFVSRLNHLAAFQGAPHWSFDGQRPPSHAPNSGRKHRRVSRYFGVIAKKIRDVKNWLAEERQFRANIRELRSLNDHALRDIGLHRGDIAALASRAQPVAELNQLREELARPVCRIIEFTPDKVVEKPIKKSQVFDNAA